MSLIRLVVSTSELATRIKHRIIRVYMYRNLGYNQHLSKGEPEQNKTSSFGKEQV